MVHSVVHRTDAPHCKSSVCTSCEGGGKQPHSQCVIDIKTNAVALGLAIANAAVEIGWGEHCSVNLPFYYSAWDYFNTNKKFRMLGAQPVFRY